MFIHQRLYLLPLLFQLPASSVYFQEQQDFIILFTGLLSFYEVLAFLYFAGAIAYGQRLWQTIQKGGPMHLVCLY